MSVRRAGLARAAPRQRASSWRSRARRGRRVWGPCKGGSRSRGGGRGFGQPADEGPTRTLGPSMGLPGAGRPWPACAIHQHHRKGAVGSASTDQGGVQVAAPLPIAALIASYAAVFSHASQKLLPAQQFVEFSAGFLAALARQVSRKLHHPKIVMQQ
jgi:hypothetical protein